MNSNGKFSYYIRKELYFRRIITVSLDIFLESDLAFVNICADFFSKRDSNILDGNRAVKSSVLTVSYLDIKLDAVDFISKLLRRLSVLAYTELLCLLLVFKLICRLCISGNRFFLGKKEIACVSVGYLNYLIFFALTFYVTQ